MRGTVSVDHSDGDFPLADMPSFSVGVLTRVPDDGSECRGDVVIRIVDEIDFLGASGSWALSNEDLSGYYYRPLRPGESVTVVNDD